MHPTPAPVADWVTIADLTRDPFPIFDRLRAEGGVHWVPAVNRYLVTSYAAVHDTELDQATYSANEEGSLMIRAMGHSMLRKDDPEHHVERRAWQPSLKPGAVKRSWMPVFQRNAERYLAEFRAKGPGADLVWDFAAPFVSENLRELIGLHNATQEDLQRWSQTMIDATGNYGDDPDVWAKGEASFAEVDVALDEMLDWYATREDSTLLSMLLRMPEYRMPLGSIRANLKMTIGGGLNEPRDAIGVAALALLTDPEQRRLATAGAGRWDDVFDEAIRWVAPIGMYSRQTTRDTVLQGVTLPQGAKLGICILAANRDTGQWTAPERFDLARPDEGAHLAFGKGVHVCLGAWVARAEVAAVALPLLFRELPELSTIPARPPVSAGWVFRGVTELPVTWDSAAAPVTPRSPSIAIVGSGPSGCFTAQALRREYPDAEITVIDRLPVPYGLVRHGVAADHQGTKGVATQFAQLFERDRVGFIGSTTVGSDLGLEDLRRAFDVVVLATGLRADARLGIPGDTLPGVHGAGRITRLLNGHPDEARPAPRLGADVAIVGTGNVSMDLVRLLSKDVAHLAGSDVDDDVHTALVGDLRRLHVVGRSQPAAASFDPVMLREILAVRGVAHVVHGAVLGDDGRSDLARELADRVPDGTERLRVDWWFGATPVTIEGDDRVRGLRIETADGDHVLAVDDVLTAIGFTAADDSPVPALDEAARAIGRIDDGLYVAGWARRGPRGTIPSQRTDAKELAATIRDDGPSTDHPGRDAVLPRISTRMTGYDGWLLIDAHERAAATPGRVRRKVASRSELGRIASSADALPVAARAADASATDGGGVPLTILFGTESGNSELVADDLAEALAGEFDVEVEDLGGLSPDEIDTDRLTVILCATYGDGELPTAVRPFADALAAANLSGLRYALFGLGDRSYATFTAGAGILDDALTAAGATRIGDIGRHDASGRIPAADAVTAWAAATLAAVPAR